MNCQYYFLKLVLKNELEYLIMHDIKMIREQSIYFDSQLKKRNSNISSNDILKIDKNIREVLSELQFLQEKRNLVSKNIGLMIKKGESVIESQNEVKGIKEKISILEKQLKQKEYMLKEILTNIPNILEDDVPYGISQDSNIIIKNWGDIPKFDFKAKDHVDLTKNQNLDFELGSKITGSRFVFIRNDLAFLERALINFMLDINVSKFNREEISPPYIVNSSSLFGTGQLPKFEDDLFKLDMGKWLIPTSEVPLTNIVREKILDENDLPLNYVAYSPCFRSEAGAAGKDTRGMIRQHQFSKVEMVSIVKPEHSEEKLQEMTSHAEFVLKQLKLPYRVLLLCSGDTGFSAKKTYDIEVWLPGQNQGFGEYREISSCSNCGDFQSRRMNARYRSKKNKVLHFCHTLNGSCLAIGRTMIAILENYQDFQGNILIPDALQPYMNNKKIINLKNEKN